MRGFGSRSRAATRSQSGSQRASRRSSAGRRPSTWLPQSGWRRSPGSRFRSSPTAARASWCCSSGSASSLTSPVMADERQLRFLIAAGGTVGHVAPALAVAEALRQLGGLVTFAGSPDRVEARLVPEHGYEFDAFAVSGLPRRPSRAFVRAAGRALAAPVACRAILRRRKPHAVLGAGGFVAGPMVLAARLEGIPCALTEADAHLGLANRLAAPLAERVFLALPLGLHGEKYRAVGRPIPAASVAVDRVEARSRLGLPVDGRVVLVF